MIQRLFRVKEVKLILRLPPSFEFKNHPYLTFEGKSHHAL